MPAWQWFWPTIVAMLYIVTLYVFFWMGLFCAVFCTLIINCDLVYVSLAEVLTCAGLSDWQQLSQDAARVTQCNSPLPLFITALQLLYPSRQCLRSPHACSKVQTSKNLRSEALSAARRRPLCVACAVPQLA